ncbi:MAG: TonB family protein [Deltaproteobacteria bacterium]|nr:TonB family protein [Deltaproteobacteria bacterium]
MAAAVQSRIRPLGRGTSFGGLFATLLIHVSLGALIYFAHVKSPPPIEQPRDLIVTKLVALGKPREKFWLPRLVQPPKPKVPALNLTDDPNAPPTPKEAPKIDDADISKEMKRALRRAQMLAQALPEEPAEGSLTGSPLGRSTEGQEGDAWATQVDAAIRAVWVTPVGLITDVELQGLSAKVRITVGEDGKLSNPVVKQSSGNPYFDDSIVQAVKMAGKVPPPPPGMKHLLLLFEGKSLAR